jgi:hypothetical protein
VTQSFRDGIECVSRVRTVELRWIQPTRHRAPRPAPQPPGAQLRSLYSPASDCPCLRARQWRPIDASALACFVAAFSAPLQSPDGATAGDMLAAVSAVTVTAAIPPARPAPGPG